MGLIRKSLSLGTLGAVDWKSDKERMAASARKTKQAARKGNKLLKEQNQLIRQQTASMERAETAGPPPGWYDDPDGGCGKRWWDGSTWTDHRNT